MRFRNLRVKEKILVYVLPVIALSLIAVVGLGYVLTRQIFLSEYNVQKEQVVSHVVTSVKLIDTGYRMLEKDLDHEMDTAILEFRYQFAKAGNDVEKIPLSEVKSGLGQQYDLIIIDKTNTIVRSTAPEGLGFNFSQFDKALGEEIDRIRKSDAIRHERIRTNVGTGLLSKFAYLASDDHQYVLELSYSQGGLGSIVGGMEPLKITSELVRSNMIVSSIRIFDVFGYEFVNSGENYKPTAESLKMVERAKKEKRYELSNGNLTKTYLYVDLKDSSQSMTDNSKIIEIVYDNSQLVKGLNQILYSAIAVMFFVLFVITIILLILSRRMTLPITRLSNAAKLVTGGDYNLAVEKVSQDEVGELTDVFNSMLAKIRENFGKIASQKTELEGYSKNLEAMVEVRTKELSAAKETIGKEKYILERILDDSLSGYWDWNLEKDAVYFSPGYRKMYGYSESELPGSLDSFEKIIHPNDLPRLRTNLEAYFKSKGTVPFHNEYRFVHKNGSIIWTIMAGHVQEWRPDGRPLQMVGCHINITDMKIKQEKIEYLSFHDQLTDLYNRRFFEEELERLDSAGTLPLSLILFDVNGLKLINDAFGHATGDRVLRRTADIVRGFCRESDIIARFGGDEFIIVMTGSGPEEAEGMVERIRARFENEVLDTLNISISFGWATKQHEYENISEVFRLAEDYMYRHKLTESKSMHNRTIEIIVKTLHEKSEREKKHSERVAQFSEALGAALGMNQENIGDLRLTGLMHDIGKIAIDLSILDKPGRLNEAERAEVERHPELGYQILRSINDFAKLADYVLAHHERWDGTGYPRKLKGEEIPLEARIIAIADAYDAMTSDRAYRKALEAEAAVREIIRCANIQFDPSIARVFVEKVLLMPWKE